MRFAHPQIDNPAEPPSTALERGLDDLRAGRVDQAVACLLAALARDPHSIPAVRALTTAYLRAGHPVRAQRLVKDLLAGRPMAAEAWSLAAQLEWKLNNRDAAVELLRRGIEQLPQSADLRRLLAVFLAARGQTGEAREVLGRIATEACHERLGTMLDAAEGRPAEPSKLLAPAPEAQRQGADALLDRVAEDPRLLDVVLNMGADARHRRALSALAGRIERLLELQPAHPDRWVGLARVRAALGESQGAMEAVDRAIAINAGYFEAWRMRARLLAESGRIEAAIEALGALLKRGCGWADIHYEIAELRHRQGRADDARGHLYAAMRINPGYEKAQKLLERCAA